jgi:hypothetical protein
MKTLLLILIANTALAQYFAPSLTTMYSENSIRPGQRYGVDLKYYALQGDKEYFFDFALLSGDDSFSDNDLARFGFGCKTGDKIKYGAMMTANGYRSVDYEQSTEDLYTAAVSFSPLLSVELSDYFYVETGMTLTAFQIGDFEVMNSYFLSIGMRWH